MLGPLLFLIYNDDLVFNSLTTIIFYADDKTYKVKDTNILNLGLKLII